MAYDFFSPFSAVTILTADGERVPLWMVPYRPGENGAPSRLPAADRPFVSQVVIRQNLGGIPNIQVSLTPPYEEGVEFLDSALAEWGSGAKVEVIIGYGQGPGGQPILSLPYVGLLLKPDVQIGDDIQYTLNAQGVNGNFLTTTSQETIKGSRDVILKKLLEGFGDRPRQLKLDVSEVYQYGSRDMVNALFVDQITVTTSNRSDWQVFYELAWEIGCWLILLNDTIKLVPRTLRLNAPPKYVLSIHDFPGGAIGYGERPAVLPLHSISSPSLGVYLPKAVTDGFRQSGIDPDTRQVVTRTVGEQQVAPARTAPGAPGPAPSNVSPGNGPNGASAEHLPGSPADKEAVQQAKAEYEAMTSQAGIKAEVTTLGVPDLFPGDVVRVVGCGRRLTTNYAMLDVTHTVGLQFFETKGTAISNVDFVVGDNARRQVGPVNRAAPDPSAIAQQTTVQTTEHVPTPQPDVPTRPGRGTRSNRTPGSSGPQGPNGAVRSALPRPGRP